MSRIVSTSVNDDGTGPTALDRAIDTIRPAVLTVFTFSFFLNLCILAGTLYMMQVFDRVLQTRNVGTLVALTILVAVIYLVYGFLDNARAAVLRRLGVAFDRELAAPLFDAVHRATLTHRQGHPTAALRDGDSLRDFLTGAALVAVCELPWALVAVILCFLLHPWFGALAVVSLALIIILSVLNDRLAAAGLQKAAVASDQSNTWATSSFRNVDAIHAMGMRALFQRMWLDRREQALGWQAFANGRSGAVLALIKFIRLFMQTATMAVGAYLAIQGQITGGALFAATIFVAKATGPVEMVVSQWKSIIGFRAAVERVQGILRVMASEAPRLSLPRPEGRITVENISVFSPQKVALLRGVSFELPAGETLAIVGPSGAGKSTLVRALLGIWPTQQGAVRLDGTEIHHWNQDDLGNWIGYVPQDVELFSGTVSENIARFQPSADEDVLSAAKVAQVHDLIQLLPNGYETQIGESGQMLSGGQRQRVALARALFRDPALIVLDEPNSNLDAAGEEALMQVLRDLKARKRTVILVTHKLSVLSLVDRILVLNQGTVQQFGPRDEVMSRMAGPRLVAKPTAA